MLAELLAMRVRIFGRRPEAPKVEVHPELPRPSPPVEVVLEPDLEPRPPAPFVRWPIAIADKPGWFIHDGLDCPVEPDTICAVPSGTYADDGSGLLRFVAGKTEWNSSRVTHMRDEIQRYAVVDLLTRRD